MWCSSVMIQHTGRQHYVIHALLTVVDEEGNFPAKVVKATLHGGDAINLNNKVVCFKTCSNMSFCRHVPGLWVLIEKRAQGSTYCTD